MTFRQSLERLSHSMKNRRPAQGSKPPRRLVLESLEDRIVPSILFKPQFGAETVSDGGGEKLSSAPVYLIYWGSYWGGSPSPSISQIDDAASKILSGPYLSGLTEYGSDGKAYLAKSGWNKTDPSPGGFTTDDINRVVADAIDSDYLPEGDDGPNRPIYLVITPPGITSKDYPADKGYHGLDYDYDVPFDVDLIVRGWVGNDGTLDSITKVMSHEIAESMSDPINAPLKLSFPLVGDITFKDTGIRVKPGPSWTGGGDGEIGDAEAQKYTYRLNGVLVQSYWSQTNGAYIVPTGQKQNFFVDNGALAVNGKQLGPTLNDIIISDLTVSGGVQVTLNGERAQFDPGVIKGITINTGSGNNLVYVVNSAAGAGVTIHGGGDDSVYLGNPFGGHSVQGLQGSVTIDNLPSYTELNVDDSADTTGHTVTISNGAITGLAPAPIFYAQSDLKALNIEAGSGGSIFNVLSTPNHGVAFSGLVTTTLNSRGDDTVNVGSAGSCQQIYGNLTIGNPSGAHTLLKVDDSGERTGRIVILSESALTGLAPAVIRYDEGGLKALTVNAGSGNHFITVTNTPSNPSVTVTTTLNTGSGIDRVDVRGTKGPLNINNMGGGGEDTVNVSDARRLDRIFGTVTVRNPPDYTRLNIEDAADPMIRIVTIESGSIKGLAAADINYGIGDINSLTISGGSGANTYTVNDFGLMSMTLNTGGGHNKVNLGSVSGTLSIIGAGDNTVLAGPNTDNTWNLTATNAGTIGTVTFSNIGNLLGGSGDDTFRLSDGVGVTGSIDGGGGRNWLDYSLYTAGVTVNLMTGAATNVGGGVSNVHNILGSPQADDLKGDTSDDMILGNGGDDTISGGAGTNVLVGGGTGTVTIFGGSGPNLLIGGKGSNSLIGGSGDDILIAGYTDYDMNVDALRAILAEWIRTDLNILERVDHLRGTTSGGLNGTYFLNSTTVHNTTAANTLQGNGGSNWFWAKRPKDALLDYNNFFDILDSF